MAQHHTPPQSIGEIATITSDDTFDDRQLHFGNSEFKAFRFISCVGLELFPDEPSDVP